jgi:hypothetical protein
MSVFFEVKIFKRIRHHVWTDDAWRTPYPMWSCVSGTQEMPAMQFHGKYTHKVPDATAATTASTKSWMDFYIPLSEIQKPCIIPVSRNPNANTISHAFFSSVCWD